MDRLNTILLTPLGAPLTRDYVVDAICEGVELALVAGDANEVDHLGQIVACLANTRELARRTARMN